MTDQIKKILLWILFLFLLIIFLLVIVVFLSAGSRANTKLITNKQNPLLTEFYKQEYFEDTEGKNVNNFSITAPDPKVLLWNFMIFHAHIVMNLIPISEKLAQSIKNMLI